MFLRPANYYWKFVKDFTKIAKPLYKNDEKEQKVELNLDKKLRLKIDASNYTTEEVLLIKCENRKQRPVVFISKSLNKVKRNNEIYDEHLSFYFCHIKQYQYL